MYEVIIIGAGPAGLTASIYSARRGLKTLVLAKQMGGEMVWAGAIENYPGFDKIDGAELASRIEAQAKKYGAEIIEDEVVGVSGSFGKFEVSTQNKKYETKTIIFATGSTYRRLGVEGEDEFTGKGVSFCATCDGPLFAGKDVAVVGGGNAAVETAIFLETIARNVYLICRRDQFKCEDVLRAKLKKTEKIFDSQITKIVGKKFVESIEIKNLKNGEKRTLPVQGVFIHVGTMPETKLAQKMGAGIDERGFIIANEKQETGVPGVFAAGDLTGRMRQVICAASQGATAGANAYSLIESARG